MVKENLERMAEAALSKSRNTLISKLLDGIKRRSIKVINVVMKEALSKLKEDYMSLVKNEMSHCAKKVNLKTMSEAELF